MIRQKVYKILLTRDFKLCFQDPEIKEMHSFSLRELNKQGKYFKGLHETRDEGDTLKRFAIFEWNEEN